MRLVGQTLAVAGMIAIALGITPACVDNNESIYVHSVLAPALNRTNGSCIYTNDATQPMLSQGKVDAAVADVFVAELLVGNGMIPRADQLAARAETNRAHIQGGVVRVTSATGATYGEFTALGNGFVDPSTGGTPSYAPMELTLIDSATMGKIKASVNPLQPTIAIANIKIFGQTLGGVDLEAAEFQYPIEVCVGCLIQFEGHDDPALPGVDCNLDATTAGGTGGGGSAATTALPPCRAGQDEYVQCTDCKATNPACQKPL